MQTKSWCSLFGWLALAAVTAWMTPACTPSVIIAGHAMSDQAPSGDTLRQLQQETTPYQRKGTGIITGQVFVSTPSGPVYAAAGTQVFLVPDTTYSHVRFDRFVVADNEMPPAVRAAVAWITTVKADGRFIFREIPGGSYLLASQMFWSPPGGETNTDVPYGRAQLAEGGTNEVAVTRNAE